MIEHIIHGLTSSVHHRLEGLFNTRIERPSLEEQLKRRGINYRSGYFTGSTTEQQTKPLEGQRKEQEREMRIRDITSSYERKLGGKH